MSAFRYFFPVFVLCFHNVAKSDDFWLAAADEFPGRLRISEGGTVPRVVFSRADHPDPAYPRAEMRISQVAVSADGSVYYCSGLDGSIMHLLNGRHEIQVAEVAGQIRDLACTGEAHTVYYSVVPTPQNGQPLADGVIYRRDFWSGSPDVVALIPQTEVGGNWWGCFTIRDGEIFLATLDQPSRLFVWSGGALRATFPDNRHAITSLSVSPDNQFIFTNNSGEVSETTDFTYVRSALHTGLALRDATVRASADGPRP